MDKIIDILGAGFGDGKEYYKEQAYEMVRLSDRSKKLTVKAIDTHVRKYLEYGLLRAVTDTTLFKGYKKYTITEKGVRALDHYRNSAGYKDLSEGVI